MRHTVDYRAREELLSLSEKEAEVWRRWGVVRRSGCFWYLQVHPPLQGVEVVDMCSEEEMVDVIRGGGEVKLWQSRGGDIWKEVGEDQVAEYDEQNIGNKAFDQVEEILTEFYGN